MYNNRETETFITYLPPIWIPVEPGGKEPAQLSLTYQVSLSTISCQVEKLIDNEGMNAGGQFQGA